MNTELNEEAAAKGYEMTNSEYYARLSWDETCKERDELKYQVKALSAIKSGLEKSLTEAFKQLEQKQVVLMKISQMSDCGSPEAAIIRMKDIASNALQKQVPTDEEIEKLAEAFKKQPYYEKGQPLSVAPQIYLKRGFIKGFKSAILQYSVSGWIDVKDRLPEIGKVVLLWNAAQLCEVTGFYCSTGFNYVQSHVSAFNPKAKDESDYALIKDLFTNRITHWQPLPSPPINI